MSVKVALIQQACTTKPASNLENTIMAIEQAASNGAKLIVLQELFHHQYFCQSENADYFDYAESIPGDTTTKLGQLAKQYKVVIVASLFEQRSNKTIYHNTAVVIEQDGTIAGKYRKMHIPDDPGFYEKFYFTPGDQGFKPIPTSVGTLAILICWDQWFPEAARLMALNGADILIYPTAIGWDPNDDRATQIKQLDAWQTVQRGHAIANNLPVISCNRYGFEADASGHSKGINFWGNSFICGPQGEIIKKASEDSEAILIADIDFNESKKIRHMWPYFRDRRIDAYDQITSHGE